MSEPFIGEIKIYGAEYAPRGWAFCDGQVLPIAQGRDLFRLIGNTYGGDGISTFALPDLRGRVPLHAGNGFVLGQPGGEARYTLLTNEMPAHNHVPMADSDAAAQGSPAGNFWAAQNAAAYSDTADLVMSKAAVSDAGASQAHENMSPYLALPFIVALQGIYPSPG